MKSIYDLQIELLREQDIINRHIATCERHGFEFCKQYFLAERREINTQLHGTQAMIDAELKSIYEGARA